MSESMHILRVFNNNVVLARDGDVEVVVTGRGVGFQAKQGELVGATKIAKIFYPVDGRDPDHLGEMLAFLPAEHVKMTIDAMAAAGMSTEFKDKLTLVVALADHLGGAIRRSVDGAPVEYPLREEVQQLYTEEFAQAKLLVE